MKIILLFFVLFISFVYSNDNNQSNPSCSCADGYYSTIYSTFSETKTNLATKTGIPSDTYDLLVCNFSSSRTRKHIYTKTGGGVYGDGTTYEIYSDERTDITYNCIANPICSDNKILDTSFTPPLCINNSDTNNTTPDTNTTTPDTNTTTPDTNNTTPDTNTTTPDTNTTGNGDDNGDDNGDNGNGNSPVCSATNTWFCSACVCPLGSVIHYQGFMDISGVYQTSTCGEIATYCDTSPTDSVPSDTNTTNDDVTSCPHPVKAPFGYPFQSIVSDIFSCIELYNAHGGGDSYYCRDGDRVACYYYIRNDTNTTGNDNGTGFDSNGSSSTDTNTTSSNVETNSTGALTSNEVINKLDSINASLSTTGAINNTLAGISKELNNFSVSNHNDLKNLSNSLGFKLDAIKNAIDNKPVSSGIDTTAVNEHLEGIENALNSDGEGYDGIESNTSDSNASIEMSYDKDKTTDLFNNTNDILSKKINDFLDDFLGKLKKLSIVHIPHGSCGCTDPTISFSAFGKSYNQVITLCAPYQSFLVSLKPVLWFLAFFMLLVHFYRSF